MIQKLSDVIEGAKLYGEGRPLSVKKYIVDSPFTDGSNLRFLTRGGAELCPIEVALFEVGFCKAAKKLEYTVFIGSDNFFHAARIFKTPVTILKIALRLADKPNAVDGIEYLRSKGY